MDMVGLTTQSSIYFFMFIIIGAFIFMNIISGVIVTNFQHAHEEHRRTTQLKFRSLGNPEPPWEKATTSRATCAPQHALQPEPCHCAHSAAVRHRDQVPVSVVL